MTHLEEIMRHFRKRANIQFGEKPRQKILKSRRLILNEKLVSYWNGNENSDLMYLPIFEDFACIYS